MSSFVGIYKEIDPEFIQKHESGTKHKLRKKLIFNYLLNCYTSKFRNIDDKKTVIMVKNTYSMLKFNLIVSSIFNLLLYKILFSSSYEYRGFQINPGNLNILIKLPITTTLSLFLCMKMWMNYCYNVDIYELAVKNQMKNNN